LPEKIAHLSRTVPRPFEEAKAAVIEALQAQGFSVLTEIDLQAKFKEKVDKDIPPYVILGACGAGLAYRAWEVDPLVGVHLPCNVSLRGVYGGTEVLIRDPRSMSQFSDGIALIEPEVSTKLQAVLDAL